MQNVEEILKSSSWLFKRKSKTICYTEERLYIIPKRKDYCITSDFLNRNFDLLAQELLVTLQFCLNFNKPWHGRKHTFNSCKKNTFLKDPKLKNKNILTLLRCYVVAQISFNFFCKKFNEMSFTLAAKQTYVTACL